MRRNFGIEPGNRKIPPAEQGIAAMMTDLYRHYDTPPIRRTTIHLAYNARAGSEGSQMYRQIPTGPSPMQVVSGPIGNPKVHFEAPPATTVRREMNRVLSWFNHTAPNGARLLPALTRTGIAHLYFVSIHLKTAMDELDGHCRNNPYLNVLVTRR